MDFPQKLLSLRKSLRITQVEMGKRLGISSNYISVLERGEEKKPSPSLEAMVDLMIRARDAGMFADDTLPPPSGDEPSVVREDEPVYGKKRFRQVGTVSWAHAGDAESYEELPLEWQEMFSTDCRDESAFALKLQGPSMEPQFEDGDVIIVMPTTNFYSGGFAVCKFVNDGIVFRQIETAGERVRLIPLNPRFDVTEHDRSMFQWIYPVYGRWTQLWKR